MTSLGPPSLSSKTPRYSSGGGAKICSLHMLCTVVCECILLSCQILTHMYCVYNLMLCMTLSPLALTPSPGPLLSGCHAP